MGLKPISMFKLALLLVAIPAAEIDVNAIGRSRGCKGRDPDPKFLHFHAVLGESWSNNSLVAPGLAPHQLGNPGSATE